MPGTKGMKRPSAANATRRQIWRSIRIMRRFTQPELIRTVPDATESNVVKYLSLLVRHGYLMKNTDTPTGMLGKYQIYTLVANRDRGPEHPVVCDRCGESLTVKVCLSPEEKKKEKEKEEETERESPGEVSHDAA